MDVPSCRQDPRAVSEQVATWSRRHELPVERLEDSVKLLGVAEEEVADGTGLPHSLLEPIPPCRPLARNSLSPAHEHLCLALPLQDKLQSRLGEREGNFLCLLLLLLLLTAGDFVCCGDTPLLGGHFPRPVLEVGPQIRLHRLLSWRIPQHVQARREESLLQLRKVRLEPLAVLHHQPLLHHVRRTPFHCLLSRVHAPRLLQHLHRALRQGTVALEPCCEHRLQHRPLHRRTSLHLVHRRGVDSRSRSSRKLPHQARLLQLASSSAPALPRGALEVVGDQPAEGLELLVKARAAVGRDVVRNERTVSAPLGQQRLRRVVCRVHVHVRKRTGENVWPALPGVAKGGPR
mmetsp:Transcript_5438/g.12691  ORF Transcript_5438/g.12691 Transcript_5438/m.12691 type:complete len:347 (-) Transcript_5438:2385-3425(-)